MASDGAEFANRPGFLRLMNALKPRHAFQALVMSEESRLGREAIETAYALKQLVQAGVRVFFYLEDRERTLDSPSDKIMLSLTAFADELEREKARQRTCDAMVRKTRAGHVTRRVLADDPMNTRPILSSLLVGRVTFAPLVERDRWKLSGTGTLSGLFTKELRGSGSRPQRDW